MRLTPGARLGPYEIVSLLGSGGMGEVYKGRDPRLAREVAVKVLPSAFSADPERLIRFEQEARAAAALSHPNIVAVYDVGHDDGAPYIVSELLDGETLRDRLSGAQLPVRKAVEYAIQIARGLSAAHERGIIHRDLKPENIFTTTDGRVKILDFGLAKLTQAEPAVALSSVLPTAAPQTTPGIVLGTVGYMSPEQVRGVTADHRADIFAFGVILYEMLSGRRAFRGETAMDTLTAILKEDPPDLPSAERHIPPALERIVDRCMEKNPSARFKSADDLAFALEAFSSHSDQRMAPALAATSRRRWMRTIGVASLIAATAALAAYVAWMLKPAAQPSPIARFTIALPAADRFSNTGVHAVAISPDGRHIVYTANFRLYLRSLDRLDAQPIRGTESSTTSLSGPGRNPFFSPDGRWIGFWHEAQLKKVAIEGGPPVLLCAAENPWGASWTIDNTIVYGQGEPGIAGIWRVSADGGKPEQLVKVEEGKVAHGPQLLPGGHAILFTLTDRLDRDEARIVVQSLDTGVRRVVVERGADARYLPTGHLVYAFQGTVFGVTFDPTTLATGRAVPLVDGIAQGNVTAQFATANHGELVYVPRDALGGAPQTRRTLAWIDRQGREFPIKAAPRSYLYPRVSPDGTRVAVEVREPPNNDIWIWDLRRELLTRLTLGKTFDQYPVWAPNDQVIFASSAFGGPSSPRSLMRMASNGTGAVEQLTQATVAQFPSTVAPDGRTLIFRVETPPLKLGATPGTDLLLLDLSGDRRSRPLVQTPYDELNAEISPDGRWLAYQSNESGRNEIYVRPFPNVEAGKRQVSTNGGVQPLWSPTRKELFYLSNDFAMRVPVTLTPTLELGVPEQLFPAKYVLAPPGGGLGRMYDVSHDGQRFLVTKEGTAAEERPLSPRMILVQNWLEELTARVPPK
jgi:serine/threonine-protein kinase